MKIYLLEGDMSRQGGTERMTSLLANQLAAEHEVHVVSLRLQKNQVFFPLEEAVQFHVLRPAKGKLGMFHQMAEIRGLLKKDRPDAVINVDVGMGIYGIFASVGMKIQVLTWEHGNFFNNWNSKLFPAFRRIAAKHSDQMIVLTKQDRENYLREIPGCTSVTVIPNPVEKQNTSCDCHAKIILSAGNFSDVKRFELIPELGKEIFAQHPDWKWVICGDGEGRNHVQGLVQEYGLEDQILLPGAVKDMDQQYRNAAMYVMTSSMEGLPMVLLEAKSFGLPLVSFDIMTGPSDIIRDGVNGYLIPDGDLPGMAERILELMESDEKRQEFSERASMDMEKFSMEGVMNKWKAVLNVR